ncbi:Uncharacterised protein [Vibrio cholerae]|nr:Uncharacterised protein [Vibrio cholerae]
MCWVSVAFGGSSQVDWRSLIRARVHYGSTPALFATCLAYLRCCLSFGVCCSYAPILTFPILFMVRN